MCFRPEWAFTRTYWPLFIFIVSSIHPLIYQNIAAFRLEGQACCSWNVLGVEVVSPARNKWHSFASPKPRYSRVIPVWFFLWISSLTCKWYKALELINNKQALNIICHGQIKNCLLCGSVLVCFSIIFCCFWFLNYLLYCEGSLSTKYCLFVGFV